MIALLSAVASVALWIISISLLGLVAQKNAAASLLGVAGMAGTSYALSLLAQPGASPGAYLWPITLGMSIGAIVHANAAGQLVIPSAKQSKEKRAQARTLTAATAGAPQPARHWALG